LLLSLKPEVSEGVAEVQQKFYMGNKGRQVEAVGPLKEQKRDGVTPPVLLSGLSSKTKEKSFI
jgi:hypothetical protein